MTDVFVSYERQDADRARVVVEALRADGLDVWWDQGIQSGDRWRPSIEEQLDAARVVVCLWSATSVASSFVRDEATRAQERGVLCPVLIEDVRIPIGFGEVQAANLIGWSGARRDPAW
ncbi:MAG TPA: toll/interleukin-1 receptor domain-containing protein, partial [Vitreimonas sp.]|nr:toll/interleukin-1 receptor domain-containing protein [Vitreimonas sp.]